MRNYFQLFAISLLLASFIAVFKFVADDVPLRALSSKNGKADLSYQLRHKEIDLSNRLTVDFTQMPNKIQPVVMR